jgi:hypothetical protein
MLEQSKRRCICSRDHAHPSHNFPISSRTSRRRLKKHLFSPSPGTRQQSIFETVRAAPCHGNVHHSGSGMSRAAFVAPWRPCSGLRPFVAQRGLIRGRLILVRVSCRAGIRPRQKNTSCPVAKARAPSSWFKWLAQLSSWMVTPSKFAPIACPKLCCNLASSARPVPRA